MSEKTQVVIVSIIAIGVVSLAAVIVIPQCVYHQSKWKMLTEGGYTQTVVPGSSFPVWVKGDKVKP